MGLTWQQQFQEALVEWRAAQEAFNQADPDYLDYHILRLYAAEKKLAVILKQAKAALIAQSPPTLPDRPSLMLKAPLGP